MDQFAAIRAFVRSVQLGSFSKVAAEAGIKVSTVSRHITALEADLGAALFNRSTRRLHLTEVGRHFYERMVRIIAELDDARVATIALNQSPRGLLRIDIPSAFGRRHIIPHLRDFFKRYPDIRIDARLTDVTVDLIESGTDLAVRIGALTDSSLVAKHLAPQQRSVVASPDYLEQHGAVHEPGNLIDHDCLSLSQQPSEAWYFRKVGEQSSEMVEVPVRGCFRSNDAEALLDVALVGLGIALLPTWLAGSDIRAGRLVTLLPAWEALIATGPTRAIWAIYPPKKIVSPKVTAFLSFLEERFGRPPYWEVSSTVTCEFDICK